MKDLLFYAGVAFSSWAVIREISLAIYYNKKFAIGYGKPRRESEERTTFLSSDRECRTGRVTERYIKVGGI